MRWPFAKIKWNSIHTQLLATYLLLTALGTSLLSAYVLWSFYAYFIQTRQADLNDWSAALTESIADEVEQEDLERIDLLVQRYGAAETMTLRIFDAQGVLLATSSPQLDQQVVNWGEVVGVRTALNGQVMQGKAKGVLSDDDRLYIARPILRQGQVWGVLRMSITLEQLQSQFASVIWTVLGTLGLTILLCTLISNWLARSLSKPIRTMQHFAIRLGSGHFGDRLTIHQSNELDQLAYELNRMSERLASLDQERRVFLANVSHELRTPISNVQVTVEALRRGAKDEPELRDRFLQTVEDETRRLSRLIHDLLELGRLEAGATALEKQVLSLQPLLERAVRAMETRMQALEISAQLNVADLRVEGDPERLLQAFLNVLDNAIKHSKPNSQISISGQRDGKSIVVTVQDQGVGISPDKLSRIFEQFYTADPSRQGSGTGLGLAIAKRIVEAHQGSIAVSSTVNQGATFIIRLPLSSL
ncbi:HAMP domain-containing histidine kinase [Oculatella sp. LEGE 06141]|uniref:sensor histidine kinase n=1 Tax=Oculatella sp. LEGE 06141 TaxID=1828648 RepID=UPI001882C785|nr:ATP-binding protein [Oculatella sp. LEGE 06141]MBE9179800.1 HAMP domain-containing histidine kinase [Oculatella sp. LEGE 06141]